MIAPTNNTINSPILLRPLIGEGREVINTPEKIEAIMEQSKEILKTDRAKSMRELGSGGILFISTSAAVSAGLLGVSIVALSNSTNNPYLTGWFATTTLSTVGLIFSGVFGKLLGDALLEVSQYESLASIPEKLRNEQFIKWVEGKNVELNIDNFDKYYSNFSEIFKCSQKIRYLQNEVF